MTSSVTDECARSPKTKKDEQGMMNDGGLTSPPVSVKYSPVSHDERAYQTERRLSRGKAQVLCIMKAS